MGRVIVLGRLPTVTRVVGVGSSKAVEPGISPATLNSQVGSRAAWWLALCMTQIFDPAGADLWCMGQVASAPCVHVHAAACSWPALTQNAIGGSAAVPS